MIRPLTLICAALAVGSGFYLYTEKHQTTLLDQQISKIVQDTQQVRERSAMLRAEWALLNQPDRLQSLSARFLPELHPMAPTQFVQMASLTQHLPAVGPETAPHPIETPASAPDLVGQAPDATAPDVKAPQKSTKPEDDLAGMAIAQATPKPVHRTAPAHEPQETQLADASDLEAHAAAIRPARHPLAMSVSAHVEPRRQLARATPHAAPVAPVRVASNAPYEPRSYGTRPAVTTVSSYARPAPIAAAAWRSAPVRPVSYSGVGSSLGSVRSALPAPVPLAGD